jgi:hypothetical protein
MVKVIIAIVLVMTGIAVKGLMHMNLADLAVFIAIPFVFVFKLLGNRPKIFVIAGMIGVLGGGIAAFGGYIVAPIQYYYSLWGWGGVVAGVLAAILLPLEFFLFVGVALVKGGAAEYVGKFISGICFGFAGVLLLSAAITDSPCTWFSKRKNGSESPQQRV